MQISSQIVPVPLAVRFPGQLTTAPVPDDFLLHADVWPWTMSEGIAARWSENAKMSEWPMLIKVAHLEGP